MHREDQESESAESIVSVFRKCVHLSGEIQEAFKNGIIVTLQSQSKQFPQKKTTQQRARSRPKPSRERRRRRRRTRNDKDKMLRRLPSASSLAGLGLVLAASSSGRQRSASALSTVASSVNNARRLGGSDLVVSEACLGTMTWAVQNTRDEAFGQLDFARGEGCNFIDTAEL